MAGCLHQSQRQCDGCHPRKSRDDRRLSGRRTRQRGEPFPDGSKMAKVHWNLKKLETFPAAIVPDTQHDIDLMAKDSKRFQDSGGWGYGVFEYDAASGNFRVGNSSDMPPQVNDAKCGFACHTIVKTRDYVFTDYQHR